ncbi:MAG: Rid family detoxifying hydrolase [Gemmatimonadota bacterium]|nr:Rid family detoxifying hydrolase [Gemmatimonadota bacterium]
MTEHRQEIATDGAPRAIGPYSQGVSVGRWVFTAGQLGADPETGELEDTIEKQTQRALDNIEAILAERGGDWAHVVKTTVFLNDLADYNAFNAVYAELVEEPFPARSAVQVADLPKGALVEIEAVAHVPK